MNTIVKLIFTAILITHGLRSAAFAQEQSPEQKTCANGTANSGGKNLSDKLAQSGGVICPPQNVDPAMKAPTPQSGTMPVIPPPGSPGGNPNVQPK
ncbi:MAG TPA: hypothetical protein VMC05_00880 [Xanthobacteraceae bacterium]|nr:hypothetical protein [Xanthobacteraceae bacterium]